MIALSCAIVPLLGALWVMFAPRNGRAASAILVGASVVGTLLALLTAAIRSPETADYLLKRYFVIDASSILFLVLISVIFFGDSVYVWYRLSAGLMEKRSYEMFVVRSLLFFITCVLAVLSNHLLGMWVFLELGTFAVAPLIYFGRGTTALRASWQYLLFSIVGLGINLLGLLCLAHAMESGHTHVTPSFFLDDLKILAEQTSPTALPNPLWWKLGLALMVFGLATKLGLAPMYSWLPAAYDEAPPSVTVLLSAVQFNCAILALFRQIGAFRVFCPKLIADEMIVLGTLSIAIASLQIIKADNYKRLIAYASINHAGTIVLGLGLGKNAGYGVVLYVVSNALVKAVLFMSCGNIKARFGTKEISALRGLIRVMPFSGWAFMLGVFALLGFAPFGSFLGEVIMLSNMAKGAYLPVFFFICIVLTVILVASGRALFPMIWGEAPGEAAVPRQAEPMLSNASGLFFIVILASLGIYTPAPITALLKEVAASLGGG